MIWKLYADEILASQYILQVCILHTFTHTHTHISMFYTIIILARGPHILVAALWVGGSMVVIVLFSIEIPYCARDRLEYNNYYTCSTQRW